MASKKQKIEALQRWSNHCATIQQSTSTLYKGDDKEKEKRIKKAQKDYGYFVQTYFPHLASKPCSKFQIDAANYILKNKQARCVFEWARGHAKSSHISLMIPLWLKIQEERDPIIMVLVSKNKDTAKRLLGDIQAELESNELYINDFGKQKVDGSWGDGEFVTTSGDMFIALGRGQSPRGIKKGGRRPNYISIDDIDDDEMVRNPRRVREGTDWCLSALYGTMELGRGRFILVGNRIGKTSILGNMAVRPRFHHTVINILDSKGRPSWKENYTLIEINNIRLEIGERLFQQEYMNNPINEGSIFEKKNIRYGKILTLTNYRSMVCYTDPSFKAGIKNDYKATLLVGITPHGAFHVIKAYADQTKTSIMVGWHYEIRDYIKGIAPVRYLMESNFLQDLLLDEFQKVGDKIGSQIPIIGDKRAKKDKFARIENMQPLFERGEVVFNEDEKGSQGMEVLEEQLLLFERGSKVHDDAPDALEGAIWILSNGVRTTKNKHVAGQRPNRKY